MDIRIGFCSAYSFLYGVHKPGKILDRALSCGVKTVSICDIDNFYGVHTFLELAKEKGMRPIIGTALSIMNEKLGIRNERGIYCFVENRVGFGRLCELLSLRNKDKGHFDPLAQLCDNAEGLVLASANCGVLQKLAGKVRHLFAAISPDELGGLDSHKLLSLPLAFLDTSLFLNKADTAVHKVLRAIGLNKTIGSLLPQDTVAEGCGIFKTAEELQGRLNSWPEAVQGTRTIAKLCQFNELFDGFIFPAYGKDPGTELRLRTYEGAVARYGELGDMEIDRIEYELEIIEKMGFSPYFLRMDDIVQMSPRTCGRGSGAASIVSYSLGITNVDPIAHNLYFERFLNPARPDPPDIDIDFAWDERDDLIRSVIEKFGPEYCARVANHNYFRPRSALRETAKAYGFSDGAITQLERKLFTLREKDEINPLWAEIYHIATKIEGLPRGLGMHCGGLVISPRPICCLAPIEQSAEGFPLLAWEKEGTEAAGFVKIDLLGNRSLAVIRDTLANLEERGIYIDPYTWRPTEDQPTIKALSQGESIGVFYIESPAMRQLQKKTGAGDYEHIVIHSSLIRPAANKFISEYVKRLKGAKWEPLHPRLEYILNESYGILCYQEDVSKTAVALAGFNEVDADKLRKVIAKKPGSAKLSSYQEQFFSGCRNNGVAEETIQQIWNMMLSFDGYSFCKPHSASYAMVSFQSAYLRVHHPAEFMAAVISNQGGYYHPGAYISECRRMGLFTEGPDVNVSRWKYYGTSVGSREWGVGIGELRAGTPANARIACGQVDVARCSAVKGQCDNESAMALAGAVRAGEGAYRGTVVVGFMAIKGLSVSGAKVLIEERERGGDFLSLDDISRRIRLSRDDIIALCPAGVFDSIAAGLPRPLQARALLAANAANAGDNNQEDLFARKNTTDSFIDPKPLLLPQIKRKASDDELWEEYRAMGFLRKAHPLVLWKNQVLAVRRVKAIHIREYINRYICLIGWPITQKEVWTKDGLSMSFYSFEDETAMYETVIFPEMYERYNKFLFEKRPLLVSGLVKDDLGAVCLEVQKIEVLGEKH